MMSMNELLDQISADQATIQDSIGTDERGLPMMLPTMWMIPLEVLVRCTVFGYVATWIEGDFIWRTECQPEGDAERERLEAAGFEASYDERDIAKYADEVSSNLDECLKVWANMSEVDQTTLERRGRGETREQVKALAKKFLKELM